MDESRQWRQMFERPRTPDRQNTGTPTPPTNPFGGYDDGYQLRAEGAPTDGGETAAALTPAEISHEAAMALAQDTAEYRPWVLQRGTRPVLMLHLRRHDPKSGLWMGWELSYPHLVAVEYTGDRLLSLDFGARQFMLEGAGLDELAGHLQNGNVLMVQEYDPSVWPAQPGTARVSAIRRLAAS